MQQYHDIVKEVLEKGTRKENRTGVDTISTFNINYEIDLQDGFPLLTTKEISWKNIVVENLWFISGEKHIGLLKKHGCKFWDAWADKNGFVPSAYGNFWRQFPSHGINYGSYHKQVSNYVHADFNDQLNWVVNEIQKNPYSRRLVVSAWYPANAQNSKLPPCHLMFIFNVQNMVDKKTGEITPRLCLHLTQRSADVALGVPYNIAGYAFILSLVSHITKIPVGIFAHTLIDAHIYTSKIADNFVDRMEEYDHVPGLLEQIKRESRPLPKLTISNSITSLSDLKLLSTLETDELLEKFKLEGYNPHPAIKFKVAV